MSISVVMILAYFKAEMYENALESYRLAGYRPGYSDAFWEVRNIWLNDNLSTILILVIVVYVSVAGSNILFKKKYIDPNMMKAFYREKKPKGSLRPTAPPTTGKSSKKNSTCSKIPKCGRPELR